MPIVFNTANIQVPLSIYDISWKVVYFDASVNEQVLGDNTTTDNNRLLTASCTRMTLRFGTGSFELSLDNMNGYYNNILLKGTRIKFYGEHTTGTPTNVVFDGRIDSIKHSLLDDNSFIMNV